MADIINLASFELDTKKLESSLSTLQDRYFDLKKEQESYNNQSKETKKQIDLLAKSQDALSQSAGDNTDALAANEKEINNLLNKEKELFKAQQNTSTQMSVVKKEINQTTTQLKAYQDTEARTTSLIDLGNAAINRQIKNKNDARAANMALNQVANQLNPNIAEEAELLKQVNGQIDKNTNFLKENSSESGKQAMNIGNYKSALEGVDAVLAQFGINGQQARTVVSGFTSTVGKAGTDVSNYAGSMVKATASTLGFKTSSQLASQTQAKQLVTTEAQTAANTALATTTTGVTVATTASTIGLKAFTIALASTGIGLIVIGLGVLFSYLKTLDPLLDKIEQGFAAVGAVVRVLGSAIANLSFDGLGKSMANAAKDASNLKEAQQDLADQMSSQEVANAKASQQYDELILKSKNRTLTEKQRIAFLQMAEKIETANFNERTRQAGILLNQAVAQATIAGQLSAKETKNLKNNTQAYGTYLLNKGKITEADLQALKDAELAKIAIDAESTKRLEKNQNAQDKLFEDSEKKRQEQNDKKEKANADAEAKRKERKQKAIDDALSLSKANIDIFIAEQGFKKKSSQEAYDFNQKLYDKELADLKLQLDKKKISQKEFEAGALQLKNEYASENARIAIENAQFELDAKLEQNQRILDSDKFLSEEQLKIKQQALTDNLAAELAFEKTRLEQGEINQREYDAAIAAAKAESKATNDALVEEQKAADEEKRLADLENQKIINENNFLAQIENEKAQNAIKLSQELADAEKSGADQQIIKDKYAQMDIDLKRKVLDTQMSATATMFGNIAQLLGENSKAGKAAAIAQATINTYQGVSAAWMAPAVLPQPFDAISKVAASGIALMSGLKAVKEITKTKSPNVGAKPSYASGVIGLRGIGTGTSDNISANLSAGESVINAKSTSMYANELSKINQAGGGVGLNGASNIQTQNNIQQGADNSQLVTAIAEAVAIGAEAGSSKGSAKGITGLSDNRKIMSDAKF